MTSPAPIPGPPYKGSNRKWFTEALFWEINLARDTYLPVFSLYQDRDGLVNCRRTFVSLRDPTGYKWALEYLGDWTHFKVLSRLEWFQTALQSWKDELDVLLQSEALATIQETAKGTSQSAYQAAKYLAGLEHRKRTSGRGRPSKEDIAGELKRSVSEAQETTDDYHRVFGETPSVQSKEVN